MSKKKKNRKKKNKKGKVAKQKAAVGLSLGKPSVKPAKVSAVPSKPKYEPSSKLSSKQSSKPEPKKLEYVGEVSAPQTSSQTNAVTNIVVRLEDEVTFIVEQIKKSASRRVAVSIPKGSDLLLSSVSMKLLAKYADDAEKDIVIITDDPAGRNMAGLANLVVLNSSKELSEEAWRSAKISGDQRAGKGVEGEGMAAGAVAGAVVAVGSKGTPGAQPNLVNKDFQDDFEAAETAEQKGTVGELEEALQEQTLETASPMDLGRPREGSMPDSAGDAAGQQAVEKRTVSDGDFEMTIDGGAGSGVVIDSSVKEVAAAGAAAGVVTAGAATSKSASKSPRSLVGRDFSSYESVGTKAGSDVDDIPLVKEREETPPSSKAKGAAAGVAGNFTNIFKNFTPSKLKDLLTNLKGKKAGRILVPLVVVFVAIGVFGYWYLPEVFVEVEVESISVEFEGTVTAKVSAEDVDEEGLIIPARKEVENNSGSGSANATGTASRGEKASGTVTIYNKTDDDITVAAGTALSNGGLTFTTQSAVTVPKRPDPIGMGSADTSVTAAEIGDEYNVAAGTTFTVGSSPLAELSATNASAFSGGSEDEYKVVSQGDIDTLADKIAKEKYAESKKALASAHEDTKWVFVESSVKNELDGDVTSDVPAGAEQDTVNVDVRTKSSALYYDGTVLDELIEKVLINDFGEEELESLELSDNIEKEVTVSASSIADGTITMTVKVKGFVMPQLDESKVEKDLAGMGWAEGIKYLKKLEYASGDPDVEFYPEWFPRWMRHFPGRGDRISVNVKNVVPEDEAVEEGTESGESEDTE